MFAFLLKLLLIARTRLKSRASLEAENLALRHQVIVLSRMCVANYRFSTQINNSPHIRITLATIAPLFALLNVPPVKT